ncbi:MAG: hypothetical protein SH847_04370 [Roseiflexaceae bacterium]|nr:hypothetical protein [Roseiflexaceae bacterium]
MRYQLSFPGGTLLAHTLLSQQLATVTTYRPPHPTGAHGEEELGRFDDRHIFFTTGMHWLTARLTAYYWSADYVSALEATTDTNAVYADAQQLHAV